MQITQLEKLINEAVSLRNPNKDKIVEYAERMSAGVIFPPIVIGHWPASEKYGDSGIVDGMHRLMAAKEAGLKDYATETKKFNTLEDALTYMYTANMAHGIPVKEGERNKRIKLIKQIDPKATLEKIGKEFGLHTSSVDRILKGTQGEGKSGPKGANASKSHKDQKPKKASQLFKIIEGLNVEFSRKRPNQLVELGTYLCPASEDNLEGEVDQDKVQELEILANHLKSLLKELK